MRRSSDPSSLAPAAKAKKEPRPSLTRAEANKGAPSKAPLAAVPETTGAKKARAKKAPVEKIVAAQGEAAKEKKPPPRKGREGTDVLKEADPPKTSRKTATAEPVPPKSAPAKGGGPATAARTKAGPRKGSPLQELFVARSVPRRGDAQLEMAFRTRPEAVAFLSNVHGLAHDEQKLLAREGKLILDPRWHGSETCAIRAMKLPPQEATRALNGELDR